MSAPPAPDTELLHDTLAEIFSRLNAQDKARCQAVCKEWRQVLRTTRGLWGELYLTLISATADAKPPRPPPSACVQMDNDDDDEASKHSGLALRMLCHSDARPVLDPHMAWLRRVTSHGGFPSVTVQVKHGADIGATESSSLRPAPAHEALVHSYVTGLCMAAAALDPPLPSISLRFRNDFLGADVASAKAIASQARLIESLQGLPITAELHIRLSTHNGRIDGRGGLVASILALPRATTRLRVDILERRPDHPIVNGTTLRHVLPLLGSFDYLDLKIDPPLNLRAAADVNDFLASAPPPAVKTLILRLPIYSESQAPLYKLLISYFASSISQLTVDHLDNDPSDTEIENMPHSDSIFYDSFRSKIASLGFPHLQSIVYLGYWAAAPLIYRRVAVLPPAPFRPLDKGPGGAGPIAPDPHLASLLAALPPGVRQVTLHDALHSLHHAAEGLHTEAARSLLARGAHVDARGWGSLEALRGGKVGPKSYLATPLMVAADSRVLSKRRVLAICTLLFAHGADPSLCNHNGENCLMLAAKGHLPSLVSRILADPRVDVWARNDKGETALDIAAGRKLWRSKTNERALQFFEALVTAAPPEFGLRIVDPADSPSVLAIIEILERAQAGGGGGPAEAPGALQSESESGSDSDSESDVSADSESD